MNPGQQIGRYMLPLGSVVAIKKRDGLKGWLTSLWLFLGMALSRSFSQSLWQSERSLRHWPNAGYDVLLSNGQTIHFTTEEKAQYDEAMGWHAVTLQWYGMAKGLGLRG